MNIHQSNIDIANYNILKNLLESMRRIKYGSNLLKVHDSKIVQIEVTEKARFDDWFVEKGSDI